jgi:hypothetical protein
MTKDQTIAALVSMRESELRKVREAVKLLTYHGFNSVDAAVLIMDARSNRGMFRTPLEQTLSAADREAARIQRQTLRETYNYGTGSK